MLYICIIYYIYYMYYVLYIIYMCNENLFQIFFRPIITDHVHNLAFFPKLPTAAINDEINLQTAP